jgi:hypothetical protein
MLEYQNLKFFISDTKIGDCATLTPNPSPNIRRGKLWFLHVWLEIFALLLARDMGV